MEGSLAGLTGSQKDELMDQVKQQIAVANAQELLTKMTEKCFKKCISKPGTSLDNSEQHCLARALYDNIPDSPDELAFQKGDTLVVLEQNTADIEGWWLCFLKGKQGICPANRLRLIPGIFESPRRIMYPQLSQEELNHFQNKPKNSICLSNQLITPKKCNDVFLYDMPPSRDAMIPLVPSSSISIISKDDSGDSYDVPPRPVPVVDIGSNDFCRCTPVSCISPTGVESGQTYDTPRPLFVRTPLTSSTSASSFTTDRSSLSNISDYDIPRLINHSHQSSMTYRPTTNDVLSFTVQKELSLPLDSALVVLEGLESDAVSAISKLLGFVGPNWRTKEKLETNIFELKLTVYRIRTTLHDLTEFSEGSLVNAKKASDKNLAIRLAPLVLALKRADSFIEEISNLFDRHDWSLSLLIRSDHEDNCKVDILEQLITCATTLIDDVRQIASFIQGNGTLLFKKSEWCQEYDYVSYNKYLNAQKDNPEELNRVYNNCTKETYDVSSRSNINLDERKMLIFFCTQISLHHSYLTRAIDEFLRSVEHNQHPKTFLAHGKLVVLNAHKLVHVGDTTSRNISSKETKERILSYSNALSDALANNVNKTKQAALRFPLVSAVQEMVDSVVGISHLAKDLKACLIHALYP